jgi:hypothetical protein
MTDGNKAVAPFVFGMATAEFHFMGLTVSTYGVNNFNLWGHNFNYGANHKAARPPHAAGCAMRHKATFPL